jgi:hypothetical protein
MDKEMVLNEVILGYRNVIKEKYNYKNLQKRSDIPKAYTEEISLKIVNYFLNYSYPNIQKRQELNEAFHSLDNYLKNPEKLLRIVIDSTSIVFKYGRHLPKIVTAGIKALKAFRRASKLEEQLVEKAMLSNKKAPYSTKEINEFIQMLSKEQLEVYITSIYNLFNILCDTELMSKIKKALSLLIEKMEKRPAVYTVKDVNGIKIGLEIIVEADAIFNNIDANQQQKIFDFIMKMEKELLGLS